MEGNDVLLSFFERIKDDAVIDSKHISLFTVLYKRWVEAGFGNAIEVRSKIIMREAKISSSSTFFDKLRYLSKQRYIKYEPSHYGRIGSKFIFRDTR